MTGLLSFITWNCLVPVQGNSFFRLYMMNDIFLNSNVKYHFVYKTTNLISGKWYIGKHSTDNLDDGYLGSGRHLKSAIKKYGKHNFKREIICFCDSEQEAYAKEAELVTMKIVKNPMTYNKMLGGEGSNKRVTDDEIKERKREYDRKWNQANREHILEKHRKWVEANRERDRERKHRWREANRERDLELKKKYYKANRARQLENTRKWREQHRDEYNAKRRAKRAANKLKISNDNNYY